MIHFTQIFRLDVCRLALNTTNDEITITLIATEALRDFTSVYKVSKRTGQLQHPAAARPTIASYRRGCCCCCQLNLIEIR